jgi:hypothetical protein
MKARVDTKIESFFSCHNTKLREKNNVATGLSGTKIHIRKGSLEN